PPTMAVSAPLRSILTIDGRCHVVIKKKREKKKRAKKREKKRENLEPVAALSIPIHRLRAISLLARSIACG
ncbi:hypothetical protein B296_00054079, partial [Ensete ventricosum]